MSACVPCAYFGVFYCRETVGTCDRCRKVSDVNMDYSKSGDREVPDKTLCLDCLALPGVHFETAHEAAMLAEVETFQARQAARALAPLFATEPVLAHHGDWVYRDGWGNADLDVVGHKFAQTKASDDPTDPLYVHYFGRVFKPGPAERT